MVCPETKHISPTEKLWCLRRLESIAVLTEFHFSYFGVQQDCNKGSKLCSMLNIVEFPGGSMGSYCFDLPLGSLLKEVHIRFMTLHKVTLKRVFIKFRA